MRTCLTIEITKPQKGHFTAYKLFPTIAKCCNHQHHPSIHMIMIWVLSNLFALMTWLPFAIFPSLPRKSMGKLVRKVANYTSWLREQDKRGPCHFLHAWISATEIQMQRARNPSLYASLESSRDREDPQFPAMAPALRNIVPFKVRSTLLAFQKSLKTWLGQLAWGLPFWRWLG